MFFVVVFSVIAAVDEARLTPNSSTKHRLLDYRSPQTQPAVAGTSGDQEQASAYRENELTKTLLLAVLALLYSFNRNINQSKHNGPTPKASTKH